MKMLSESILLLLLMFFAELSGCSDQAFWVMDDAVEYEYEQYTDYDARELEEQINGYWRYMETSEKKQEEILQAVDDWETEWITVGEYVVGKDIEAGTYIARPHGEEIYVADKEAVKPWDKTEYRCLFYNEVFYLQLVKGDRVYLSGDSMIALAGEGAPLLAAKEDGIYYEGSYYVGKEIPEGEYFAIESISLGHVATEQENNSYFGGARFWYVRIEDCAFVNVSDCILFPAEDKPAIQPIWYQGTGEGEGQYVYPNGTYKIGIDLPLGTYKLKNELFPHGNNSLGDEGYHGNVTEYYPAGGNWCGLVAGSGFARGGNVDLSDDRKADMKKLGWIQMELDNRINRFWRSVKITKLTSEGSETEYDDYLGQLPTVTFTEEHTGCCVQVKGCILIPFE